MKLSRLVLLGALLAGCAHARREAIVVSPAMSLEEARDLARQRHVKTILLRRGVYTRSQPLQLDQRDNGIEFRAVKGENVIFCGGICIDNWQPVKDPAILSRVDPGVGEHLVCADLRPLGITDFGRIEPRGMHAEIEPCWPELFFNGAPMTLARWPNFEYALTADIPGGIMANRFTYGGERPTRWTKAQDAWLHGYWRYDWADRYRKIISIDTAKHEIAFDAGGDNYGTRQDQRYYALNLLEELDWPGEWYLDRASGMIYFWPPSTPARGTAILSTLAAPLIEAHDASDLVFEGITFECTRGAGAEISGGSRVLITDCVFRNLGTYAARFTGGSNNGIRGCDIHATGEGGVILGGGDRQTLIAAGNFAADCDIYDFSRISYTYRPAVLLDGVGNHVFSNHIHDAPHCGIFLHGNDHLIEYNELDHLCMETADCGAFYMGRDLTERGNVVRGNYFHDIGTRDRCAIYIDDCAGGVKVLDNICVRTGRGILIGGGRDNLVAGNIFVDCDPAIHVDRRGETWEKSYFDGTDNLLIDRLKAVHFDQPPWSIRYPQLRTILSDDPGAPKYNRIIGNISTGGRALEVPVSIEKMVDMRENRFDANPLLVTREVNSRIAKRDRNPAENR